VDTIDMSQKNPVLLDPSETKMMSYT